MKKRAECPSILYQGKIYIFGGFGEHPDVELTNEVYDPALDVWSPLASFPIGKHVTHQGAVLVDDKIWHIGGRTVDNRGPITSQVLIFDITSNTWANGPELKDPATGKALPMGGGGAALIGRTIHVFGGFSADICIDQNSYHLTIDIDKWLTDPQNTSWENRRSPMPIARNHVNTTVLGGKIYALGGQFGHDCNGADQVFCHVYDPLTDTWTRLSDLPAARSHSEGGTFTSDGKLYMVGGQGPTGSGVNTVLVLDPQANNGLGTWSNATELQLPGSYYGISSKVIGSTFIISHGALVNISDERTETYAAPITRNIPYELGFTASCISKTIIAGRQEVIRNLLFTVEEETQYTLSSSAPWLSITKNASGVAVQAAVDVEATIDTRSLIPGDYTATITANGTGDGPTFKGSSFCVNLKVLSENEAYTLEVNTVGPGTVSKSPDLELYPAGSTVSLTATPAPGFLFAGWSGDVSGTANPLAVSMTATKSYTATFVRSTRLNAGGVLFTDGQARMWATDAFFTGGVVKSRSFDVAATTDDELYLNYRNAFSSSSTIPGAPFSYAIPLEAGTYNIKLHFIEPYYGAPGGVKGSVGARVFHVDIEGQRVLNNFDIYAQEGAGKAVVKMFNGVNVTGGNLDVLFTSVKNNATISGIEFEKVATTTTYTLATSTTGSGTVSKSPDQSSYTAGTEVTLTATPATGYTFAGWNGDASGTTNPMKVLLDKNKSIVANFTASPTDPEEPLLLFTPTSVLVDLPVGQQKELKVNLNNSDEDPLAVQLTASEGSNSDVPSWLLYEGKTLSNTNNVIFNLGASGNEVIFTINAGTLNPGTYTATVRAFAAGYSPAELIVTLEVASYEESLRPYITAVRPGHGATGVSLSQSVSVDVAYPSGKSLDGNTVNTSTVKLYKVSGTSKTEVSGTAVNATAAGDAITLSGLLQINTTYEFHISDQVKDGNGYALKPFTSRFTTITSTSDVPTDLAGIAFSEQILVDNSFGSDGFTTLVIGPDNRLYAATSGGKIERWDIKTDGTLANHITISPFSATRRLLIGLRFAPSATASNLVAWISHSSPEFADAPEWSGKISRVNLTNPASPQVTDYVINLPRSTKDHATNSIDFGPDGALYFLQGSNTAMGAPDGAWGYRPERLLTSAVLQLDIAKAEQQTLPLDVKTEEGGTYNPHASSAALTIYATGIRNAYDLVWHSNGQLYVPTNGSAAGGNTPALKSGAVWSNGQVYTGPDVPEMTNVRDTQSDYLFRVVKGGYYGHPNVLRGEYIMNGGNPTSGTDPGEVTWTANGLTYGYPVGTPMEPNHKGWAFDFGLNKSPNGVIEFKSNAFEGKLKGKLLVCRFSGGDDIMVLEPGTTNLDIIRATEGSDVPGLRRPFANPLDMIEDVRTGNLYISEYFDGNGGGQPRITLLRVGQPQVASNLINAGGNQYTDSQSRTWSADVHFSGGLTRTRSFDVAGTTDDALYLSYRYAASGAPFSYNVPVTEPGTYVVKLYFLEPYFGAPGGVAAKGGERVFHVDVEGLRVLSNYDIFLQDGAGKSVVKTYSGIEVKDGTLDIVFSSLKDNAIISAIEFEKVATSTNYSLTTSTTGNGSVGRSPDQSNYTAGTEVTLTATPASGYTFAGWSGDASGTTNPLTLTMNSNKNITATFTAVQQTAYSLSVIVSGNGTVTSNPDEASHPAGSEVTLTAVPAVGFQFSGWSGDASGDINPLVLTMDGNKEVTAGFTAVAEETYTITAEAGTGGSTSLTPSKSSYASGDNVKITATPDANYEFVNWTGDITDTSNPLSVTVTGNLAVKANFKLKQYRLVVSAGPGGNVSWSPEQSSYEHGTTVTLTANPDQGYQFSGWSGSVTGMANPTTITMDAEKSVTANFVAMPTAGSTVRINAGGPMREIEGIVWTGCPTSMDCNGFVSGGNPFLKVAPSIVGVPQFMDRDIFETGWTNSTGGSARKNMSAFAFNIPVTNGDYLIRLYFADLDKTAAGQRVFDVNIEGGKKELTSFDIVKEAGRNTVVMREIPMKILDGTVTIDFIRQLDNPIISAIGIVPVQAEASANAMLLKEEKTAVEHIRTIKVYPNPMSRETGNVEMENFGKNEVVNISVYTATGQKVYENDMETDVMGAASIQIRIDKQLNRGIYFIKATSASGSTLAKLLIE
ncbi:malectin domain-containing carbohydrate-binding protein [Pontibacter sp. BT731]|uniref:InlB B-repeat-containing protein n=1 Tax=Pontibacter coccineus TaxID=3063328 RepID=UPI0026E2E1D7|nr:malectin domain-containing carbohydrate-binding protein [Pontibacter sp. BT731]MDO6388675.1 malectin domain-containing carbohydrate-binding protein [Pontibacter sp. BT731]